MQILIMRIITSVPSLINSIQLSFITLYNIFDGKFDFLISWKILPSTYQKNYNQEVCY